MWWHMPLIAIGIVAFLLLARFSLQRLLQRRLRKRDRLKAEVESRYDMLYRELWDETKDTASRHTAGLKELGVTHEEVTGRVAQMRAQQSSSAGVSMRYLLSSEFEHLARSRTSILDPSFEEMKTPFWPLGSRCAGGGGAGGGGGGVYTLVNAVSGHTGKASSVLRLGDNPIGAEVPCPRDGRPGCALVDWIPRSDRREQTHFMSWVWRYRLSQIHSALQVWARSTSVVPQEVTHCFQKPLIPSWAPMTAAFLSQIKHMVGRTLNGRIEGPCICQGCPQVFFFMCFFVNNQFRVLVDQSQSGSHNLGHVFRTNLLRCGQMVAVLDTWKDRQRWLRRS